MSPTTHIVEVGGRGGVYQHAVAVADSVAAAGVPVVLHTATDAEVEPGPAVRVCRCMRWFRDTRPRSVRSVLIALWYVLWTTPHLARAVSSGDIYHFQGEFKSVLTSLGLLIQRALPRRRVVQSRHNTFSRHGGRLDMLLMRLDLRVSHATIVFTEPDERVVREWGGRPVRAPLAQHVPSLDPGIVERWRRRWGQSRPVLLFAGQVRHDKRLDLLLDAVAELDHPVTVAVVGEDVGAAAGARAQAERLGIPVIWELGYVPLEDFVGAIAAADAVVCPYEIASQSGVLAVARSVGTATVATDVGGLSELATVTVPPGSATELARGMEHALGALGRAEAPLAEQVARAHLTAYAIDER